MKSSTDVFMTETINEIAAKIRDHCIKEIEKSIPNRAFGRSSVLINEIGKVLWLTGQQNVGSYWVKHGFNGEVVDIAPGVETTLRGDGEPIYKNTHVGGLLIQHRHGKHKYKAGGIEYVLEILNSAKYAPDWQNWAIDVTIHIDGGEKPWSHRNLREYFTQSEKLSAEIDAEKQKLAQAQDEAEARKLLDGIEAKKRERDEKLKNAQRFIRVHAQLRYQPVLDKVQDAIRREEAFGKTMVINGGPGTGKTTTLIQRIKFLLDLAKRPDSSLDPISDDDRDFFLKGLSREKRNKLVGNLSWVFFSPSELLKLFLQNAMASEGLDASSARVKVWADYKAELIRGYKLVNPETQRPFLFYKLNQPKEALLPTQGETLKKMIKEFMDFYLKHQTERLAKLVSIKPQDFEWRSLGNSIIKYIDQSKERDFQGILRIYYNLNRQFSAESEQINVQYRTEINSITARWLQSLQRDVQKLERAKAILTDHRNKREEDDEDELDNEAFEEETGDQPEMDQSLMTSLKSLIRKQALSRFDKDTRLSAKDKAFLDLMPELRDQPQYVSIGQKAYYKKFFEKACKGVVPNLYRELPMLYKKFRRANSANRQFYGPEVTELIKDENKRLHDDEQAFLLYIINRLVSRLQQTYSVVYNEEEHPWIKAHKLYKLQVIAIDEATDFHVIDLLAMRSLGDQELFCVTLSGDLMQRMTRHGIRSWDALEGFVKDEEGYRKENMTISYRQSPTLLELAKKVYQRANGADIDFSAFIEKSDSEPKPLRFMSDQTMEKIGWYCKRILEIHKTYGDSIPSIAIFTKDDSEAMALEKDFRSETSLTDVGIVVKACTGGQILGNENTVRIFAVPFIKGLEFEAVFFHNIDELHAEPEMLSKYLYVALSRATFYLAVTHTKEFIGELQYLNESFQSDLTWKL